MITKVCETVYMRLLFIVASLIVFPVCAHAYVGPGAGLGAIAVAISVVLGVALLLVGFLWYPIKRMLRSRKASVDSIVEDEGK